jgi:hypothetical protein
VPTLRRADRICKVRGLRREWNGSRSGERGCERGEDAEVGVKRDLLDPTDAERGESGIGDLYRGRGAVERCFGRLKREVRLELRPACEGRVAFREHECAATPTPRARGNRSSSRL